GKLHATAFGKAISLAGFKPESGVNLLKFFAHNSEWFSETILENKSAINNSRLILSIFYACFSCPEFVSYQGRKA
ncbi:hypothetical protein QIG76_27880, partial [Klebsiella pneumoniae]|nr:hypothetical protein [Klebsiella pneumoniae]